MVRLDLLQRGLRVDDVQHGDVRAGFTQRLGESEAEAARGTRDHGRLAFEGELGLVVSTFVCLLPIGALTESIAEEWKGL